MTVDELIIAIRVNAEGVKQGIEAAKTGLRSLTAEQAKWKEELKLRLDAAGVTELKKQLQEVETAKRSLEREIRFGADAKALDKIQERLRHIEIEKIKLERQMSIVVDDAGAEKLLNDFYALADEKKELEKELIFGVHATGIKESEAELARLDRTISNLNNEIQVKIETSGAREANDELAKLQQQSDEAAKTVPKIGAAATATFIGIVAAVKTGVDAFNEYTATMNGFESQMKSIGADMDEAMEIVKEKASDGLISQSDVAASIKNLTTYGLTVQEAAKMVDRLKDSAAYNRQAHYSLSEAVRVTTEGIRMENSALSDAAGVPKNLAKMMDEYAKSLGRTTESLTASEKAQAVYNGFMRETESVVGNAAEFSKTLAGSQAELAAATKETAVAFGEAMAPAVQILTDLITPLISKTGDFAGKNKILVSTITAVVGAYAGLVAVKAALTIAFKSYAVAAGAATGSTLTLNAALRSLMLSTPVLALTMLVGAISLVAGVIGEQKRKQEELNEKVKEYKELTESETTNSNIDAKRAKKEEIDELIIKYDEAIKKQKELEERRKEFLKQASAADVMNRGSTGGSSNQLELDIAEVTRELKDLEAAAAEFGGISALSGQSNLFAEQIGAHKAKEDLAELSRQIKETAKNIESLRNTAKTLSTGGALGTSELLKLIELYPQVARYIADTGDLTLKNGEIIEQVIQTEQRAMLHKARLREADIKAEIAANEAKIASLSALVEVQQKLSQNGLASNVKATENATAEIETLTKANDLLADSLKQSEAQTKAVTLATRAMASSAGSHIEGLHSLESALDKVRQGQSLTGDEIRKLISLYPELDRYLMGNGDLTFKNGEILRELADVYRTSAEQSIESQKEMTRVAIEGAKARISAIEAELLTMRPEGSEAIDLWNGLKAARKELNDAESLMRDLIGTEADLSANRVSGAKSVTTEYEKQIKLLEDKKSLTEMTAQEEYDWLVKINDTVKMNAEDQLEHNKRLYAAKRELLSEDVAAFKEAQAELFTGDDATTDYQQIINNTEAFIKQLIELYSGDYPETIKALTDDLNGYMVDATEKRVQKLASIEARYLETTRDGFEKSLKDIKELEDIASARSGLVENGVEIKFGAAGKLTYSDMMLKEYDDAIAVIRDKGSEITAEEKKYLDDLSSRREDHLHQMTLQQIAAQKEAQAEAKKAYENNYKNQVSIEKAKNKVLIEETKARYAEEIRLAESAANAEISVYQDKINAIDELLKQESRADTDTEQLDKIRRLQEQLAYEVDEANKYELSKEIANEQAEFDKRKRRESLEDEKTSLRAQIDAAKDNLAEQKKLMQSMQEAELTAAEQSLNTYIETLNAKLEEEIAFNETVLKDYQDNLDMRQSMTSGFIKEKEDRAVENANTEFRIAESGVNRIIQMLYSKLEDFASVGRVHGSAYASAFSAAMADMQSVQPAQAGAQSASAQAVNRTVTVNQTIQSQVASPSQVARATEELLVTAVKYL